MPHAARAYYDVSPAQRRLWTLDRLQRSPIACNFVAAALVAGELESAGLERALAALVRRHEALRTTFAVVDGVLKQRIDPAAEPRVEHAALHGPITGEHLRAAAQAMAARSFDLERGPLFGVQVLRGEDQCGLCVVIHRIICDEWSILTFVGELLAEYRALSSGAHCRVPRLQLKQHIRLQNRMLSARPPHPARDYYHRLLANRPPALSLPQSGPRPAIRTFNGGVVELALEEALIASLRELSDGADIDAALVAVAALLLARYTGQDDIMLGTSVPGSPARPSIAKSRRRSAHRLSPRRHEGTKTRADDSDHAFVSSCLGGKAGVPFPPQRSSARAIGCFGNLLVLRGRVERQATLGALRDAVARSLRDAAAHRTYPFDALIEELGLQGDSSRADLVDIHVRLKHGRGPGAAHVGSAVLPGHTLGLIDYDLDFDFTLAGAGKVAFRYNRDLFDRATIERMAGHFRQLILSWLARPHERLAYHELLTPHEREQLLVAFNDSFVGYPRDTTVVELFEIQAARCPADVAVVYRGRMLTYHELNAQANQLARYLRERCGVGRDDFVNVMIDGSEWLIIGFVAILKAGGAYLPIDPNYPEARISYMVDESRARVHLCSGAYRGRFAGYAGEVIDVEQFAERMRAFPAENPERINAPGDLAYIIYTSGSTGRPKGILQTHRCLANFIHWQANDAGFERRLRVLQFAALSFDVSVQEILFTLVSGGALYVIDDALRKDLDALKTFIIENRIEVVDFPFTVINVLFNYDSELARRSCLKHIISAGELWHMTPELRALLLNRPEITLHNHYGPAETHMLASHSISKNRDNIVDNPPLGTPISNMRAYVLDNNMQLVPIGGVGELCIGGPGLSRGYLGRPDMTAARFIPNPFEDCRLQIADCRLAQSTICNLQSAIGARLYKTGDLARWLSDGAIELLGRKDDLVKIRGYRIELGEVEKILLEHEAVRGCVVVARRLKHDQNELVAYVAAQAGIGVAVLRAHLARTLPDYMIPAYFVQLDALPLSPNGKVDKRALPDPALARMESGSAYVAPNDRVEAELARIWAEELGVGRVGVHDNFFDLGGNSVKGIMVASRALQSLGLKLSVRDLFIHQTIAELGALLAERAAVPLAAITPVAEQEHYALSNAQRRLWLTDQTRARDSAVYNVPVCYLLEGALDVAAFARALATVVARHEALRTTFVVLGGEPRQRVGQGAAGLEIIDLSALARGEAPAREHLAARAGVPFELSRGPLLRATLIRLAAARWLFAFTIHHIVSDARSLVVLMDELRALYAAYAAGRANPLPALPIQYKDAAVRQQAALLGGQLREQQAYWHRKLAGQAPPLALPIDYPRPVRRAYHGTAIRFLIDAGRAAALRRLAQRTGASLFIALVALVKLLLRSYTDQEDITVGIPIAGRDHPDLKDQIGFYVQTLALRDRLAGGMTLGAALRQVQETALEAYEHDSYPFDLLVEELNLVWDAGRHPLFDVFVALQEPVERRLAFDDELSATRLAIDLPICLFDLAFEFEERVDVIETKLQFDSALYDHATVELMKDRFVALIDVVCPESGIVVDQAILDAPIDEILAKIDLFISFE